MCGVFGTTAHAAWAGRVDEVVRLLGRRGPDANGVLRTDDALLAHTRLAIIGLGAEGVQPATSRDGSVVLSYNGEIYNYAELARLRGLHDVRCDTEVLADLLAGGDPAALRDLRGMYAFVAWDERRQTLLAMRDPFGIKPLYVLTHQTGGVSLCSEIGPLLLSDDARSIDPIGLAQYLAFGHTGPVFTMFERVHKLVPGRLYRWTRTAAGTWQASIVTVPSPPIPALSFGDAMRDSVKAHLVADVEVGAFLSGGVDSTVLTALASRQAGCIRTFTLSMPESPERDESALAEHNAALIGTMHTTVPVTSADMAQAATTFVREQGEPLGDAAVLPLTHLAAAAARDVKVVLCGEGADELFGGYARYRVSRLIDRTGGRLRAPTALADTWGRRRNGKPWSRAVEAVLSGSGMRAHAALLDADLGLLKAVTPTRSDDVMDLVAGEWAATGLGLRSELARARSYDLNRWLPNVYLEKTDRATMSAGLEARVPFLDHAVAAAARSATDVGMTKAPIRALLHELVPGVALPDRKKGLAVDIAPIIRGPLAAPYDAELRDPDSVLGRWLGPHGVRAVAERCDRSPYLMFRVAMLGVWEQLFDGSRFRCDS